MSHGPEEKRRHEACQRSCYQRHRQQKRQIAQYHGVAQRNDRRRHLAYVVGRRAADGHAVDAETAAALQADHHQRGSQPTQQGEQQCRRVAGKQTAQTAPGQQDHPRRSRTQLIQGEPRHDVGKAQLHARQRHHQRYGKQAFQGAQPQRQRRQHGAQGEIFRRPFHRRHPTITSGASAEAAPSRWTTTCAGRQTMDCPARVMVPVCTQSWVGQSLSATRTPLPSAVMRSV